MEEQFIINTLKNQQAEINELRVQTILMEKRLTKLEEKCRSHFILLSVALIPIILLAIACYYKIPHLK